MTDPAIEILTRFHEAERRAKVANSDEARFAAREEARRLFTMLLEILGESGVISAAYEQATDPEGKSKTEIAQELSAHVLLDIGRSWNSSSEVLDRPVGLYLRAVAGELIGMLRGLAPSGVLPLNKPKSPGRPQKSLASKQAWIDLTNAVLSDVSAYGSK